MRTTLLLDADVIAYRMASGGQKTIKWNDEESSTVLAPFEEVAAETDAHITALKDTLCADDVIVCLSVPTAEKFRVQLWANYTNRKSEKPHYLQQVKDYMAETYRSFKRPGLEADDIMGILSTHPSLVPGLKIIVSIDKDMKTIPGWLYNPDKDTKARLIPPTEAERWWMYQTLMGDSVDCYPGCPGVGPKKAEAVLFEADELDKPYWPEVVKVYESRGFTAADALLQARLARILRHTDYDFKTKEVKLWSPPSC